MDDNFTGKSLKEIYQNSEVRFGGKVLAEWVLGIIKLQALSAASNGCSDIQINLKEEYIKQRHEYFSPNEYAMFRAVITIALDDRQIKYDWRGGHDIINISWL